ncbi:MAG: hypothetical protein RIS64_4433 [Bacteroidota bacterium]|jgi:hypothetical protein
MTIRLWHKDGLQFRGIPHFRPLLEIVSKYPFPKPSMCSRTNPKLIWLNTSIHSLLSDKFLKYIEPKQRDPSCHMIIVDNNTPSHLTVAISQQESGVFSLSNVGTFIDAKLVKKLFIELVQAVPTWDNAQCGTFISGLTWLQYFNKEEVENRGGFAAFESNPYVQTQRIHDGLLVQVGDNPDAFDTPEGEQLLVNAINALPPLKI